MVKGLFPLILLFAAVNGAAETLYVNDVLTITMRSGRSQQHAIVKLLKSGAPLEVVSRQLEDGKEYVLARATDGTEGWVLAQYLSAEPVARDKLSKAEQTLQGLSKQHGQLREQHATLAAERRDLEAERERLGEQLAKLERELKHVRVVAAEPLVFKKRNEALRSELDKTKSQLESSVEDNRELREDDSREWFITGAVVVGLSILVGIVLTRIRWRRRSGLRDTFR